MSRYSPAWYRLRRSVECLIHVAAVTRSESNSCETEPAFRPTPPFQALLGISERRKDSFRGAFDSDFLNNRIARS